MGGRKKAKTSETCRKSTARSTARNSEVRPPVSATVPKIRHNRRLDQRDSSGIFGRAAERLAQVAENRASTYTGPMGMGIGKGGMRRLQRAIRRTVPTRRQIERQTRISASNSMQLAPFARYIRQLIQENANGRSDIRIQTVALSMLKEVCETYLVNVFETCSMYTAHAGRVTLMPKDIELYQKLKRMADSGGQVIGTGGRAEGLQACRI